MVCSRTNADLCHRCLPRPLFYLWQCVGRDLWGGQNTARDFAAESVAARRAIPCAQGEGV